MYQTDTMQHSRMWRGIQPDESDNHPNEKQIVNRTGVCLDVHQATWPTSNPVETNSICDHLAEAPSLSWRQQNTPGWSRTLRGSRPTVAFSMTAIGQQWWVTVFFNISGFEACVRGSAYMREEKQRHLLIVCVCVCVCEGSSTVS